MVYSHKNGNSGGWFIVGLTILPVFYGYDHILADYDNFPIFTSQVTSDMAKVQAPTRIRENSPNGLHCHL